MIKELLKKHWKSVSITYTLFIVENVLAISWPFLFGNFINDCIQRDWSDIWQLPIMLIGLFLSGTTRNMYDTRVFTKIYKALVTDLINRQRGRVQTSKVAARVNLSHSLVSFLEDELPRMAYMTFSIIGGLVFIFVLNFEVGCASIVMLILIGLGSMKYSKKISLLTSQFNDLYEREVDNIDAMYNNPGWLYKSYRILSIRYSDTGAKNQLFNDIVTFTLMLCGVAWYIVDGNIVLAGSAVSMYQYVMELGNGIGQLPWSISRYHTVKDTIKRMEE